MKKTEKLGATIIEFSSESEANVWFAEKKNELGGMSQFINWLDKYFQEGNEVFVADEQWDYWSCYEAAE